MRSGLALAALCLLGACQPTDPRRIEAQAPAAGATDGLTVGSLSGAWRVAGIDGEPLNETYGIALEADETSIWWSPRCARQERLYTIAGGQIEFRPVPENIPTEGGPPVIVCTIGPPAKLAEVMRALDAAQTIQRTQQNGILISGQGRSVTLFSQ